MKKFPVPVLVLAAVWLFAAAPLPAATYTSAWENGLGTGVWEHDGQGTPGNSPQNWSTFIYPSNGRQVAGGTDPNPLYNVVLNIAAPCTLGGQVFIQTLNVSGLSTVNVISAPNAARLRIQNGQLSNNGTIALGNATASGGGALYFENHSNAVLSGSGAILLRGVGATYGLAHLSLAGGKVTHAAGHLIHGRGSIDSFFGGAILINDGTISADDPNGGYLHLNLSDVAVSTLNKNNNLIQAVGGGVLFFPTGYMEQSAAGRFLADGNGSIVRLGGGRGPKIVGGSLETANGGLIESMLNGGGVILAGVTNNGAFRIPHGNNPVVVTDGLTNNNTITIGDGLSGSGFGTQLRFDNSSLLGGNGDVRLRGFGTTYGVANIFITGGALTLTHGADHLIHGYGSIDGYFGGGTFINNGTISGDDPAGDLQLHLNPNTPNQNNNLIQAINGGALTLLAGAINQTANGRFLADGPGSVVKLGAPGGQQVLVNGGKLETANGGIIRSVTGALDGNITNAGAFEIPAAGTMLSFAVSIINNGTMTLRASDSLMRFDLNHTTIGGTGAIVLTNNAALQLTGSQNVTNADGHTIKGNGIIYTGGGPSFTNNGTFAPGLSAAGKITFNANFKQGNSGVLEMEIGGTSPGTEYDQVVVGGTAFLAGKLNVRLINGFLPSPADTFKVVPFTTLSGGFNNVVSGQPLNTLDGKGSFIVTYTSTGVVLSSFGPPVGGSNLPLSVRLTSPTAGGDTGVVTMTLAGQGVQQGATVRLRRAGQTDINGHGVTVSDDGTSIRVRFNLNGQPLGAWDVVVTNPDGTSVVIAGAFTVEAGRQPQIWTDILGGRAIRLNSASRFTVLCGNHGNTDAYAVPVFITGIPKNAKVSLLFGLLPIPALPGVPEGFDPNSTPPVIQTASDQVLSIIIPAIPAGTVGAYEFTIEASSLGKFSLRVFSMPPLLETSEAQPSSPEAIAAGGDAPFQFRASGAGQKCLDSFLKNLELCLLNFFPGNCANLAVSLGSFGYGLIDTARNPPGSGATFVMSGAGILSGISSAAVAAAKCAGDILPFSKIVDAVSCGLNLVGFLYDCGSAITSRDVEVRASHDPNDKAGSPGGGGVEHYITGTVPMPYAIFFENKAEATAPAQEVVITDQLDVTKFNLNTFQLGPISFGKTTVLNPPAGVSEWIADADLRPENNLIVRVIAALNKTTGMVTWRFFSLDPATMLPTNDPVAGFLPPNQTAPEGDGAVAFTIEAKPGQPTGTQILNQARIIFDTNAPIDTPTYLNTIDVSTPSSYVLPLPASQGATRVELTWTGSDTGAGIANYTIYVSKNGGPFIAWLVTSETSAFFDADPGATYEFYSIAQDGAGNREAAPSAGDASITIPTGQALNISTRLRVQTGENVLIGGFIITGTDPKKVIIRAIGPSLGQFFAGALADPTLELYQGNTLLMSNNNWVDNRAEIEATTIPPTHDLESAIVATLAPGAYTAVVRGNNGGTGIAVVEAYDLDQGANSKLGNLSTRGFVEANDNAMIGGVIVGPNNGTSTKVMVRAIGPSLSNFGIAGALQDPTLEVRDINGTLLEENDDWGTPSARRPIIEATTIPPVDRRECAVIAVLTPGNYTAIVRGKNNSTGVGLVEVYNIP